MQPQDWIWHNGRLVPWAEATVHVSAHALHYGSSVFEGIRAYQTPQGSAIFRLDAHIRRLFESARLYRCELPFDPATIRQACRDVVTHNGLASAYIRPIAYLGTGSLALHAPACPVEMAVIAFAWGAYLGQEGLTHGIDVGVSSWQRPPTSAFPVLAKAGGHYLNSQLIAADAIRNGYDEGIAVDSRGMISEGSGENLFLVRDGVVFTPPLGSSILGGITRDTVLRLAEWLEIPVREQTLPREMLYLADEVFLTGTAAEITPVRSVDRLTVGTRTPGPITKSLQDAFFGLFDGRTRDQWGWLDHLPAGIASAAPSINR